MFPLSTKGGGICFAFPDVCLVPAAPNPIPTPLPNQAGCTDALDTSPKVKADGKEVLVLTSRIPMSSGDEAGTGGGVMSGTFKGPASFRSGSNKVIVGGKRAVMLTSRTAQNGENPNAPAGTVVSPSQSKVIAGS